MVNYVYPDHDLHGEPTLKEMLAEPIIRLIMQRDGVAEQDMLGAMEQVKRAYGWAETAH